MFPYFYPAVMPQYCPSVRPSVTFRYRDHICWNTSKIISPPNSDKIVMWRFLRNRRMLLCLHTIFRALIYWAHRAVILAIAWHLVKNIRYMRIFIAYYHAMLRKAQLWDCMSSVRLCDFQTGWNTLKIIARPNSLGSLLSRTPTGAVWCNGNTPKMGGRIRVGQMKLIKATIFLAS